MYIYYKEIKNILSDTYIIRLDNALNPPNPFGQPHTNLVK